ncbi:MAG: sigma-70 family RNA polymerase sigma factor [Ruminococcus sp.]|nr:sigma-70 family RNA polymerase sigma factor [Ruminococcus sp.]
MTGSEYSALLRNAPEEAHERLFNEYYSYVRAVAYNRLRNAGSEDVEECISDIFAEVFLSFDDGDDSGDLKGYIGTVAKRISIDHYRKLSRRTGMTFSVDDENSPELRAEDDLVTDSENAELRRIMMDCIKALGEPDSTIIIQKFYYNRNSRQIGRLLSMKPSAVRMRSKRAAEKLKEFLIQRGIKEDLL